MLTIGTIYTILNRHRGVAQFGRAPCSGRGGRKFESCRLDSISTIEDMLSGSLVKGLRRRPLTAETGVRFPYLLLQRSLKTLNYQWFSGFYFLCVLKSNQEFIVRTLGQEGHRFLPDPARA